MTMEFTKLFLLVKQKEKTNQKKMHQLTVENRHLTEPLAQKEKQRAELQEALKTAPKDRLALKNLRGPRKGYYHFCD